jgi:exopolysaccharide biosynthesis polyprenyl glycosylphosphotransferase
MVPQEHDVLMGSVKTSSVLDEPLISVTPEYLPTWQRFVKRGCDIVLSLIAIILLLPVYLFLAIGVKRSSPGPVFYLQERVGYLGKPFNIIKFRSMSEDAESGGPMLSSDNDPRITAFGKFMRQYRLDETPQFFNVLRGDMSLVGPRPERQFYIDQIVERAPYYQLLLGIKPGITSWGQVRFGYAENVDEMVERLRWDILYIENMSLLMDVKILIYTVLIILKREGK